MNDNSPASQLDGYGCWCNFGENYFLGRGQPVDLNDQLCKQLHDGYACAVIDSEQEPSQENDVCEPWKIEYKAVSIFSNDPNSDCKAANKDNTCAANACTVETYFQQQVISNLFAEIEIDVNSFGHSKGFDSREGCPINQGVKSESRECCGEYPIRFPYKSLDGARACCDGRTYSTVKFECCDDGTISAACI